MVNINNWLGSSSASYYCRLCEDENHKVRESLGHILNACKQSRGVVKGRHDELAVIVFESIAENRGMGNTAEGQLPSE